tara:strand:+ start:1037 stop:1393 length:357 start_codon:yes stop_codon:yes gene_type:complete
VSEVNWSIIRGEIFSSGIFLFLFILHIIFAANQWWFLFNLVAIMIFFSSHFHTLKVLYFSKSFSNLNKIHAVKYTTLVSIFYSTGFWYAVNDMQIEIWIFILGLIPVLISTIISRYWA